MISGALGVLSGRSRLELDALPQREPLGVEREEPRLEVAKLELLVPVGIVGRHAPLREVRSGKVHLSTPHTISAESRSYLGSVRRRLRHAAVDQQRAALVGAAKGTDGEPPRALSSCVSHCELA